MTDPAIFTPDICVIIVSYNFEPWIHTCLTSIRESEYPAKIVVVDNASQDRTCEIIKSEYPDIILIKNHENLGFGKANNIGMKYALGNNFDYVFLLNQDAWIEPTTLGKLIKVSKENKQFGILSPVHFNGKGTDLDKGFADYSALNYNELKNNTSEIIDTKFVNAAMWLIPSEVLRETGGFAPLFSHYGEDVNLAQRIRKNGYQIGVVILAIGYHDREFREVSREKFFYSEFVYFLTEAANPAYSKSKAFAYSVLAAKKKALKSLFSNDLNAFREYISISFQLMKKSGEINRTRKITSEKGAHFL